MLTATALLAALLTTLASGLLLLLTGLLLTALLAALLTALLLLPALLHITHLVVRHGELSLRGRNPLHDNFSEPLSVPSQPIALSSNTGTRRNNGGAGC